MSRRTIDKPQVVDIKFRTIIYYIITFIRIVCSGEYDVHFFRNIISKVSDRYLDFGPIRERLIITPHTLTYLSSQSSSTAIVTIKSLTNIRLFVVMCSRRATTILAFIAITLRSSLPKIYYEVGILAVIINTLYPYHHSVGTIGKLDTAIGTGSCRSRIKTANIVPWFSERNPRRRNLCNS